MYDVRDGMFKINVAVVAFNHPSCWAPKMKQVCLGDMSGMRFGVIIQTTVSESISFQPRRLLDEYTS